jgi:hypothetical protein
MKIWIHRFHFDSTFGVPRQALRNFNKAPSHALLHPQLWFGRRKRENVSFSIFPYSLVYYSKPRQGALINSG